MTLPNTADFIIIGGGVMGASTAYHLAARGYRNIVLLEKEDFFGLGATGRCAGGVRYQFGTEINVRLSIESLPMLERFEAEIGQAIDYRKCGYLFVLTTPEDVAAFKRNVSHAEPPGGADRMAGWRRGPPAPAIDAPGRCFGRHLQSARWAG